MGKLSPEAARLMWAANPRGAFRTLLELHGRDGIRQALQETFGEVRAPESLVGDLVQDRSADAWRMATWAFQAMEGHRHLEPEKVLRAMGYQERLQTLDYRRFLQAMDEWRALPR